MSIKILVSPPTYSMTVYDIKANINRVSGRAPPKKVIYDYLKKEIKYSYKRGSTRPLCSKSSKLKYLQAIFSWRIMKEIEQNRWIINIDESSYSRSIKTNYSWLPKGKRKAIINSAWIRSANMIFGLWTNGNWIGILSSRTTMSDDFWRFLLIVQNFIKMCLYLKVEDVTISLDNAPIHLSSRTRRAAHIMGLRVMWLPPYSPSLAPVEWVFGLSKKKLDSRRK